MTAVSPVPTPSGAVPSLDELFAFARTEITWAAGELWPGARVQVVHHVPSVTGYVLLIAVGGRSLYAKYSFLGMSLVSLLRDAGSWPRLRSAQRAYVRRPDALLGREARQLRLLTGLGRPRVCALAGTARGVLFTEPVPGVSLADVLVRHPARVEALLERVLAELDHLHRPGAVQYLHAAGTIAERSIAGTFGRKFANATGQAYLDQVGAAEPNDGLERCRAAADLRMAATRLLRLAPLLPPNAPEALCYGDLKPEHVVYPDGLHAPPVLIDPGLLRADVVMDAAKLLSRTVLLLTTAPGAGAKAGALVRSVAAVGGQPSWGGPGRARRSWLRELAILWLMDTVNIVSTYMSAPPAFPLPDHGLRVLARAGAVCQMAERISTDLESGVKMSQVWDRALSRVEKLASHE